MLVVARLLQSRGMMGLAALAMRKYDFKKSSADLQKLKGACSVPPFSKGRAMQGTGTNWVSEQGGMLRMKRETQNSARVSREPLKMFPRPTGLRLI